MSGYEPIGPGGRGRRRSRRRHGSDTPSTADPAPVTRHRRDEPLVAVALCRDRIEGELLAAKLEAFGIAAMLRREGFMPDESATTPLSPHRLFVLEGDVETAREILATDDELPVDPAD